MVASGISTAIQLAGLLESRSRIRSYWRPKLRRNVARDLEHLKSLSRLEWKVLTVWECELGNEAALTKRLVRFLR